MKKVLALLAIFTALLYAVSSDAAFKVGPRRVLVGQGGFIPPTIPKFLGQVATRTMLLNAIIGSNKQVMSRRWHFARINISSLQIIVPNYYIDATNINGGPGLGNETGSGGTATVTASVEYPVGVFTQIKFSGTASHTIASGAQLISDAVTVAIPKGAKFFIRVFYTNATAIVFGENSTGFNDTAGGDLTTYAASGLTDQTMSGTVTNTDGTGQIYWSVAAIIATMTTPAICLAGDSRVAGYTDLPDKSGDVGNLARTIGPFFPYINLGVAYDEAKWIANSGTNRAADFAYCSHLITEYGVNDILNDTRTAVQLQADLATIWSAFPSKPKFHVTYEPETTSTNSWATVANQTVLAREAVRLTMNAWIRGKPSPLLAFFEIANFSESAVNSGFWKAPGYTTDGVHPSNSAYVALGKSGIIPLGAFH